MTQEQLEARRKYYRDRYKLLKERGELPKDRYTPEQRSEYNKKWKQDNPDYFLKKEKEIDMTEE